MIHPLFDQQLEETRNRLDAIRTQARAVADPHLLLPQALEEVSQSLEELRVAEEELQSQSEELHANHQMVEAERRRYQELLDFGPDAYLVTDALGNILEANRASAELLGVNPSFLLKKPLIIFVAEEAHEEYRGLVADIRAGQKVQKELAIRPRQGSVIPAEVHVGAARTCQGLFYLRWIIRDLSERHAEQQASKNGHTALPKEQLSAIARMLTGFADTTRDALMRNRSILEKLAAQIGDESQTHLLAEIRETQEELRQLCEDMRDYISPVLLEQR
jgi:PAS domain S-box-containing protein